MHKISPIKNYNNKSLGFDTSKEQHDFLAAILEDNYSEENDKNDLDNLKLDSDMQAKLEFYAAVDNEDFF